MPPITPLKTKNPGKKPPFSADSIHTTVPIFNTPPRSDASVAVTTKRTVYKVVTP